MAATFYSSFFSSGLLAHHIPSAQMPGSSSPSTPRAASATLVLDDITPTAHSSVANIVDEPQALPSITVSTADDSRPRLRRRRSSLAGASSPLAAVKTSTPIRHASASVQRNLRTRSGSDASIMSSTAAMPGNDTPATKHVSKPSRRYRTGSLGNALRRGAKPSLPPPTVPLPPVPPLSSAPSTPLTLTRRPPLGRRAETFDNYDLTSSPFSVSGASPMCLDDEDRDVFAAAAVYQPSSPARLAFIRDAENTMQVDYPSPIDSPVVLDWTRHKN